MQRAAEWQKGVDKDSVARDTERQKGECEEAGAAHDTLITLTAKTAVVSQLVRAAAGRHSCQLTGTVRTSSEFHAVTAAATEVLCDVLEMRKDETWYL